MQWVTCVCALADGTRLASGSSDKTIRIWKISNSECESVLRGHDDVSMCCCCVPLRMFLSLCFDVICMVLCRVCIVSVLSLTGLVWPLGLGTRLFESGKCRLVSANPFSEGMMM